MNWISTNAICALSLTLRWTEEPVHQFTLQTENIKRAVASTYVKGQLLFPTSQQT